MRGRHIFNTFIKDEGLAGSRRKGRNNTLIVKRNECLTARYYYYGFYKNKTFEETLQLLVGEFFISPNTISFIIGDCSERLHALKQKSPTLHYFQYHWPHLKW
jgi:hypothetical protein